MPQFELMWEFESNIRHPRFVKSEGSARKKSNSHFETFYPFWHVERKENLKKYRNVQESELLVKAKKKYL